MSASATTVGWLGTGRMGTAMAARLLDAGDQVLAWNRTRSKTRPLADRGASVASELSDLGGCDLVFITVAGSADLEQVVTDELGLLAADPRPAVIVDCSTVSVEASARVRAAADAAGVGFLAAPVSGNPHVVAAGGASIVASGPDDTFRRAKPYLERIAGTVTHAGTGEQSRLVKLCHNLYLGMMVQALVEVTALAEKGGTDRAAFLTFLNGTGLGSEWTRRRAADLISRDWTPTFTTELLRKDFDLGLGAARSLDVPLPVASVVSQLIQSAINTGLAGQDFLALYDQQARAAGLAPDQLSGSSTKS
jgi:3-hydroxyisobutyrate dehydrogenase-like beta-hydroxyacid dehydrogenase